MDWIQRLLIMLLDVECYQGPWWHPAFLSFSTFYRAAWHSALQVSVPWTPKGPSVRGPVGALLGRHCWQFLGTVVSAGRHQLELKRLWRKAVWSAKRMGLWKISLRPQVIVFPAQACAHWPQNRRRERSGPTTSLSPLDSRHYFFLEVWLCFYLSVEQGKMLDEPYPVLWRRN